MTSFCKPLQLIYCYRGQVFTEAQSRIRRCHEANVSLSRGIRHALYEVHVIPKTPLNRTANQHRAISSTEHQVN